MSIIVKASGSGNMQAPEGVHRAACVGIYDVGTQPTRDPKYTPKRRVVFVWELVDEIMPDGRPFVVSREFTMSLHERAGLRKALETWRGRAFTDAELAGFDLVDVLGKPCQVQVVTNERGYSDVAAVMKFAKGMNPIRETHNRPTSFGIDGHRGPVEFPEGMPEWIVNKVKVSPEYRDRVEEQAGEVVPDAGDGSDIPF